VRKNLHIDSHLLPGYSGSGPAKLEKLK